MEKVTLTLKETAEALGVSLTTLRKMCSVSSFPAVRVSPRRIVVPVDGLREWLAKNAGRSV